MKIKKFLKEKLGNKYQNFYLKNILLKIFGKFFYVIRNFFKKKFKKFNFLKTTLNKKIEQQKIIENESGFIIILQKIIILHIT